AAGARGDRRRGARAHGRGAAGHPRRGRVARGGRGRGRGAARRGAPTAVRRPAAARARPGRGGSALGALAPEARVDPLAGRARPRRARGRSAGGPRAVDAACVAVLARRAPHAPAPAERVVKAPRLGDAYARGARIVGRRIAGEYVLVPLVTHGADLDAIFNLN